MPFVGSIIPPSSFGNPNDKKVQRRRAVERAGQGDSGKSKEDEAVLSSVEGTDVGRVVTGSSSNESEEGHDDRAKHGAYSAEPGHSAADRPARRSLDVQG